MTTTAREVALKARLDRATHRNNGLWSDNARLRSKVRRLRAELAEARGLRNEL